MKLCKKCLKCQDGKCLLFNVDLSVSKSGDLIQAIQCRGRVLPKKNSVLLPIKKQSDKALKLWNEARRECFAVWGKKCFLCNSTNNIEVHHWQDTRTRNPSRKYDITNLIPLCKECHNHSGNDERFEQLKTLIGDKLCLQAKEPYSI